MSKFGLEPKTISTLHVKVWLDTEVYQPHYMPRFDLEQKSIDHILCLELNSDEVMFILFLSVCPNDRDTEPGWSGEFSSDPSGLLPEPSGNGE